MMSFLSTVVTSLFPSTNNQLRNSSHPRQQATIHNGRVTVQPVQGRQSSFTAGTSGTRANILRTGGNNSEVQRSGKVLNEEELEFLADPGVAKGPVTQTVITHNTAYQANDLNAYNSDCNEISTAKVVLLANLSSYGSYVLFEVPHSESTHNDMLNQKETLMLEEESRSKMLLKQSDPIVLEKKLNIKPINYFELNQLFGDFGKRFVPQQELSNEQTFWLQTSHPYTDQSASSPIKIKAPRELPKVSLVNTSLKKLKYHLGQFDTVVKKQITLDALTEGEYSINGSVVINNNDELECFDPGNEIDIFANVEDDDYFLFMFVIQIFLPYLIYPETYKQLYDSIKPSRVRAKEHAESLVKPSFLCCNNCEGPHESFQCQSMHQNFFEPTPCYEPNSSSFDQYQPLQSFVTQQLPQRSNEDIWLEMEKLIKNNRILLNNNIFPHEEASMEVLLAKERILKLIQAWEEKQIELWSLPELLPQLLNDSRTIDEMLKQQHSIQYKEYLENSSNAITTVLPTEEPEYSLMMMCHFLMRMFSKSLFDDEEINSDKIDPHYFNTESDLIESLSNRDTLFDSSPKFDYLEEFSGELMPTSIINEERIMREYEEYISLIEKLLAINSFPRPLENFHANTINETLPTFTIPVEDSDSLREEIDIFTGTDDLIPPRIESDDYDSERDIHFLEELLGNYSISLPKNESSNFDHNDDPSFPRPPPKPPDVKFFFDFEPNSGELISAVMNNIDELNEDECFDPGGGEIDVFEKFKDDDYFPFIFVIRIFLPYLIYPEVSPLLLFAGRSEDTIFDPGIFT
nr:hypothetical protein [Tanacetum cinerariifolium]